MIFGSNEDIDLTIISKQEARVGIDKDQIAVHYVRIDKHSNGTPSGRSEVAFSKEPDGASVGMCPTSCQAIHKPIPSKASQ